MTHRSESLIITKRPQDLEALDARIAAAQDKRPKPKADDHGANALGTAWRLSTEMVVAVLVGLGLGYGLDYLFGTKPWIMLVGMGFGFAAGIRNVLRLAARMNADTAHIPIGDDIGFDDDEDDY